MAGTAARCKSITVTGVTGAVKDPISFSIIQDDELIEKVYSDGTQPKYYVGKETRGITFTCADKAVYAALYKGKKIASLVCVAEGSLNSEGTIDAATAVTATLTNGIVLEAVAFESSTDGSPVEYTVTVMTHHNSGSTSTLVVA